MEQRIITYSFLAHLNNEVKSQSNFNAIFLPLVMRCLAKMSSNKEYKGSDIKEIELEMQQMYSLDMPNSMLKMLLGKIAKSVNTVEKTVAHIYRDGSFIIKPYTFEVYEEEIKNNERKLEKLEETFTEFKKTIPDAAASSSIFTFIESNKQSIGKYIGQKYQIDTPDNTIAARFVSFIQKIPDLYKVVQSVYIGSIISTYLEYTPKIKPINTELVFDTNFLISLIDLNTPSSTQNCKRLLDIASKMGYKFSVLSITINEFDRLLHARVYYYDTAFLAKQLDPEDIYNACERRKLTKTDLETIRANIAITLQQLNISIVEDIDKFQNKAKFSTEYEQLKAKRNTSFAALHDATCIEYVKERRGRVIYHFDKVNCWFVNNSSWRGTYQITSQPYQIKTEDLLNLLWLASPMVKSMIPTPEMSDIGLSRMVTATLDSSLPNASVIRKLDENIQKYARDVISDEDIVRVSRGIAERTISDPENLNEIADKDKSVFVQRLTEIVEIQKKKESEVEKFLNRVTDELTSQSKKLNESLQSIGSERDEYEKKILIHKQQFSEATELANELAEENQKLRQQLKDSENEKRKIMRAKYIYRKILIWRGKSIGHICIFVLVIVLGFLLLSYLNHWQFDPQILFSKKNASSICYSVTFTFSGLILSGFFIKRFSDKYNQSAVNAFKSSLEIPAEMEELF